MTYSGHRVSRVLVPLLAGLAAACLVLGFFHSPQKLQQPAPDGPDLGNPAGGFVLALQTDRLPDPVSLADGGATRAVTRFGLRITSIDIDGGRAVLSLEEETPGFNDYGDATATAAKEPTTLAVTLRKSDVWYDRSEGTLYDITSDDSRFANRFRYLRPPDPGIAHRLVVRTATEPEYAVAPERILELRDSSGAFAKGGPVPERFHLTTLIRNTYDDGQRLRGVHHQKVAVRGSLADSGELHLDPNLLGFSPTGRVNLSTAMDRPPIPVAFRELDSDAAGAGRRAFELVPETDKGRGLFVGINRAPNGPRSYTLVLAADQLGPHRLVVKQEGMVRQLLPLSLYNPDFPSPHPAMLATLPESERAAVVRLRDRYGKQARFYANDGHVWYVVLLDADDDALPDLRELKGLRYLQVFGRRMTDEGLRTLGSLAQLKELTVHAERASDAGLVHLEGLQSLRHLNVIANPISKDAISTLRSKLPQLQPFPRTGIP